MASSSSPEKADGRRLEGLPPLLPERPLVLVLGSFPSVASLGLGRYYGHPRNHFWAVMAAVLGEELPGDWEGRSALLLRRGVAVWDCIASCERAGSLDAAIRAAEPNPVLELLAASPGIGRVALNGGAAAAVFASRLAPELGSSLRAAAAGESLAWRPRGAAGASILLARLPSTSPIPTRAFKTAADKVPLWRAFLGPALGRGA